MAGIGFELRRILAEDTFTSMVKGYLYATVISAGPWLLSVVSLAALGIFTISFLGVAERQLFATTIVYTYGGSLVGTGLTQMVITRYLSDRLYQGEREVVSEAFAPVVVFSLAIQAPIAIATLWGADLSPGYKFVAMTNFFIVSLIWQTMIFLSASRDYLSIVISFAMGAVISIGGGLILGRTHGVVGYLSGFCIGQFAILALFTLKLIREFGLPMRWDWGFLPYITRYPQLVAVGFFYNLSVWIDKAQFGFSPHGMMVGGRFATYTHYDSSMFIAFAAVVPAMAIFLARTETDFAEVYKRYYDDIFFRRPYGVILESKRKMTAVLRDSFSTLLKVQGLVTFVLYYAADDILLWLDLPYSQTSILRFALLGALMQILMLFIHIVLLYFDLRGTVAALTALFFVANALLTQLSIELGFAYYGAGFACAAFIGLAASVLMLYRRVADLEYITFARRKIAGQSTPSKQDLARPGGGYGEYLPCPGGSGSLALSDADNQPGKK